MFQNGTGNRQTDKQGTSQQLVHLEFTGLSTFYHDYLGTHIEKLKKKKKKRRKLTMGYSRDIPQIFVMLNL